MNCVGELGSQGVMGEQGCGTRVRVFKGRNGTKKAAGVSRCDRDNTMRGALTAGEK